MFITPLKTMLTIALRKTFDADYLVERFRGLHISIEFPDDRQHYPGVWVDFEPMGEMERIGIGHYEVEGTPEGGRRFTRWKFQGYVTYTVAALSSLERDLLLDELIRVFAFGDENESTSEYRALIEDNEMLAMNIDFDQVAMRGSATAQGTPWGTEEMIYEATIALEVLGEFMADSVDATLLPLTGIVVVNPYTPAEGDPDPSW